MDINENDIKRIVSAMHDSRIGDNDKEKYVDWLFKALIGVIVWITVGLKNDV